MAVLATNTSGHLQNQLTRSLERILEDANQSGELKLSNRKLKDFPKAGLKYNLSDTVIAGEFTKQNKCTPKTNRTPSSYIHIEKMNSMKL